MFYEGTWIRWRAGKWHWKVPIANRGVCDADPGLSLVTVRAMMITMPDPRAVCGACFERYRQACERRSASVMPANTPRLIDEAPPFTDGPTDARVKAWANRETRRA